MKAVILAAGYATRLYPLTIHIPKALLPVNNKAILDHLLEKVIELKELDDIYIVSNHRFFEPLFEWSLEANERYAPKRIYVLDDGSVSNETRRGAIGDIQFAIEKVNIDDDILVCASDNLLSKTLAGFFEDFRQHGKDLLLAGRIEDYEERKRYAILKTDENGRITDFEEKPKEPKGDIAAFAEYIYRRDTVRLIGQYLREGNNPDSPGHFPEWLYTRKEVRAYLYKGDCVDIGTLEKYAEIQKQYSVG